MAAGGQRHFQLGADTIGRSDQDRIAITCLGDIEKCAKAPYINISARAVCRANMGPDGIDQPGGRIDVDPGLFITAAVNGFLAR